MEGALGTKLVLRKATLLFIVPTHFIDGIFSCEAEYECMWNLGGLWNTKCSARYATLCLVPLVR
jgi:hypothetical protein